MSVCLSVFARLKKKLLKIVYFMQKMFVRKCQRHVSIEHNAICNFDMFPIELNIFG